MKVYTYSEGATLARPRPRRGQGGEIRIERRDGSEFSLRPVPDESSPLDVPGVSRAAIREARERHTTEA